MSAEVTYDELSQWLDGYFQAVNGNQGDLDKVVKLTKYFTADFQFVMYTRTKEAFGGPFPQGPSSRSQLLLLFVHPGLLERLSPQYYVIDLKRMIAVVQFEVQFFDESTGNACTPPLQNSAHYHLVLENGDLKITKIQYWTELPQAPTDEMYKLWVDSYNKEVAAFALNYINAHA